MVDQMIYIDDSFVLERGKEPKNANIQIGTEHRISAQNHFNVITFNSAKHSKELTHNLPVD